MRLGDLKVDFMPLDEKILGFNNRWYPLGLKTALNRKLTNDATIRIPAPPLFVATKLEAFRGRGNNDPLMSSDVEDILILLDGRPSLFEELTKSPAEVRQHAAEDLEELAQHAQFEMTAAGFARGDTGGVKLIGDRIGAIAALK